MERMSLKQTAKQTAIVILMLALTLLFIFGFRVVLLILGGALFALFFEGIASYIHSKIPKFNKKLITGVSVIILLGLFTLVSYILYPRIADQIVRLKNELPEAVNTINESIASSEALSYITENLGKSFKNKGISTNVQHFFSSIFGVLGDFYIVIMLGVFFLIEPAIYAKGMVKLFPKHHEEQVEEMFESMANVLKGWLLGKFFSMLIVGVLTGVGLYVIGIPLALSLAIIAAITAFIPNVGPILALVPALLIAMVKGEEYVYYTLVLYTGIQIVESNIITPLIQRKVISFPMALILIAQVVLGLFSGYLGLVLATPIVAIVLLLVKKLYVQNLLEREVNL